MAAAATQPGWSPIQAGEIVTTGTLTGLHPVRSGDTWTISIEGIELPAPVLEVH
jgi:2-keto-4-pentenoate hydratase